MADSDRGRERLGRRGAASAKRPHGSGITYLEHEEKRAMRFRFQGARVLEALQPVASGGCREAYVTTRAHGARFERS